MAYVQDEHQDVYLYYVVSPNSERSLAKMSLLLFKKLANRVFCFEVSLEFVMSNEMSFLVFLFLDV